MLFNPLLHEFFFSSLLEKQTKMGCYLLPTHGRGAHRIFFLIIPSDFKIEILDIRTLLWPICNKGLVKGIDPIITPNLSQRLQEMFYAEKTFSGMDSVAKKNFFFYPNFFFFNMFKKNITAGFFKKMFFFKKVYITK